MHICQRNHPQTLSDAAIDWLSTVFGREYKFATIYIGNYNRLMQTAYAASQGYLNAARLNKKRVK